MFTTAPKKWPFWDALETTFIFGSTTINHQCFNHYFCLDSDLFHCKRAHCLAHSATKICWKISTMSKVSRAFYAALILSLTKNKARSCEPNYPQTWHFPPFKNRKKDLPILTMGTSAMWKTEGRTSNAISILVLDHTLGVHNLKQASWANQSRNSYMDQLVAETKEKMGSSVYHRDAQNPI